MAEDEALYSYRHANRLFKKFKGESINSFGNKIRIQAAAEYLLYTDYDLLEIALAVGFESGASFSKAFKKVYAQSPSTFRKTHYAQHALDESLFEQLPQFELELLNNREFACTKGVIEQTGGFEEFFKSTRSGLALLSKKTCDFSLLWNEDPQLSLVRDCPYLIAVHSTAGSLGKIKQDHQALQGNYAVFNTTQFMDYDYENWHEIACLVLNVKGIELREAHYEERFQAQAVKSMSDFYPYQVAVPIQ